MFRPITHVSASFGVTTLTQWNMTVPTTTLKIVGDKSSPCITHWYPLKGRQKYLTTLATVVSWSQYVQRSQTVLGPTPYAARSSRVIYRSNVL